MSDIDILESLRLWRQKYGEEKTGSKYANKYHAIPISERRHLLIIFLRWMKAHGKEKEDFKTSSFKENLAKICFGGAPVTNKEKREAGRGALFEELEDVIVEVFVKKSRKIKNSKQAEPPKKAPAAVVTPEPVLERHGKEVDRSLYAGIPKTEVVLDEEFAKLLGVDADE